MSGNRSCAFLTSFEVNGNSDAVELRMRGGQVRLIEDLAESMLGVEDGGKKRQQ
jgi:hypothetical protein